MEAAFKRLAESRVEKILEGYDKLGILSDRGRYRYHDAWVDKMEVALFDKLADTMPADPRPRCSGLLHRCKHRCLHHSAITAHQTDGGKTAFPEGYGDPRMTRLI
jgi:hypothetical protein